MVDLFTFQHGACRAKADSPDETNLRSGPISSAGEISSILLPKTHASYTAYTDQPRAGAQTYVA